MQKLTLEEIDFMRRCAKRELSKREFFYPKWVASGKLPEKKAEFELEGMRKICSHFDWLQIHSSPRQMRLFEEK